MNEFDELKKKLLEVAEVVTRLAKRLGRRAVEWLMEGDSTTRSVKLVSVAAAASFLLGAFFTFAMIRGCASDQRDHGEEASEPGFSLIRYLFGKTVPVPGLQKDKSFVLSNFEQTSDLKTWSMNSAKLEVTKSHKTEGNQAGKVTFFGGVELSGVSIEDYFESRKALSNWSGYGSLSFDIHNGQNSGERLILQIKDKKGERFKMDLNVPGGKTQSFEIPLKKVGGSLDITRLDQFTIFRWEAKKDTVFFIDNIRLVPEGKGETKPELNAESFFDKAPPPQDRPMNLIDYGFQKQKNRWMMLDPGTQKPVVRVPLIIKDEAGVKRYRWPAQGGVPFPPGQLMSAEQIRLRDAGGNEIPFQGRVLARWPDKSIRWLQVDLMSHHEHPYSGKGYFLDYGEVFEAAPYSSELLANETDEEIRVQTGPMAFTVSKKRFHLFKEVYVDGNGNGIFEDVEKLVSNVALSLSFLGKEYFGHLDESTYQVGIEEKGSEKIGIKASGWFQAEDKSRFCQWIVRIHAFKGKSYVRVFHTFIYTGYPANRYYEKYKDFKLPENEPIEEIQIKLPLILEEGKRLSFGDDQGVPLSFDSPNNVSLLQENFDTSLFEVEGTNVSNQAKATGWMDISNPRAGVAVAVRDFRENFPKELSFRGDKNEIIMNIWPGRVGELDLETTADALGPESAARGNAFGLAKTHELFFYFHTGDAAEAEVETEARAFFKPLILRVNPYWVDRTGALGRLYPSDAKYAPQEIALEKLFDWAERQPRNFKWYGMVNFGDTLSWYRNEDEARWYGTYDWHPVGRWGWYNCENAGMHSGTLLQYVRTGQWRYFVFGENSARHIMDIDTVHYNTVKNDPRLKALDDEVSQPGSMHRHNGNHWGDRNEESTHTNVYGILLYYYLTGYERAFDVAKEVGSFFLQSPFTYTGHPDIAPHRAMANALWGDVQLYQATWDEAYKKAADRIVDIYMAGQEEDGSYLETYNPLTGQWTGKKHHLYMASYAVPAFIAYHELTQDKQVLSALDKMVRYIHKAGQEMAPSVLNGLAYLYLVTGNSEYIQMAEQDLAYFIKQQQSSSDPLTDGLIFKKPIYHRPNVFLYSVPWVFAALEESFERPRA